MDTDCIDKLAALALQSERLAKFDPFILDTQMAKSTHYIPVYLQVKSSNCCVNCGIQIEIWQKYYSAEIFQLFLFLIINFMLIINILMNRLFQWKNSFKSQLMISFFFKFKDFSELLKRVQIILQSLLRSDSFFTQIR